MKTTEALKEMNIFKNGEIDYTVKITCPCQMWRQLDLIFDSYGDDARVQVLREDGTTFKDFTVKRDKNGKRIKVNSIKETNRGFIKKQKAEAAAKAAEEKKAKRRAADRARRAKKKAEAAAAA